MSGCTKIVVTVLTTSFLLMGCAIERKLSTSSFKGISAIKVVRYDTPALRKAVPSTEGVVAAVAGGILLGGFGGAIAGGVIDKKEMDDGREMMRKYELPDFGKVMSEQFVERVSTELPGFPPMQLEQEPVKDAPPSDAQCLVTLRVYELRVGESGFTAWISARMTNGYNMELWLRDYVYKSKDHNRSHSLNEYEAEGGVLIKEEYRYALDHVVSTLVRSLKGS